MLEVLFSPPEELPPASVVSLQIKVGDLDFCRLPGPAPCHVCGMIDGLHHSGLSSNANFTRYPTRGKGPQLQPASIGLAVRRSATTQGGLLAPPLQRPRNDTAHKNAAVSVHWPESGPSLCDQSGAGGNHLGALRHEQRRVSCTCSTYPTPLTTP